MDAGKNISASDKIITATNSIIHNPTNDFREQLTHLINELINDDFNALVQLLYRIDVSETKLKNLLNQQKDIDASSIIADLIIERQLQKIATKKQFSGGGNQEPEDSW